MGVDDAAAEIGAALGLFDRVLILPPPIGPLGACSAESTGSEPAARHDDVLANLFVRVAGFGLPAAVRSGSRAERNRQQETRRRDDLEDLVHPLALLLPTCQ